MSVHALSNGPSVIRRTFTFSLGWTGYNRVNGVQMSEKMEILQDILRKEWGYQGLIMSDCNGSSIKHLPKPRRSSGSSSDGMAMNPKKDSHPKEKLQT